MSKTKRIITYAVTIAVIAAISVAAITFLRRSMRDTVYLQDYALTLGSDDLFVNENSNIYELSQVGSDYVYVSRIRHDDSVTFFEELNTAASTELSPYEFAATHYSGLIYVRGDGSLWRKDSSVTSGADHYIRLKPFFYKCSAEDLEPVEGHEIEIISKTSISFDFKENRKLSDVSIRLSVKLNDGNWYLLNSEGFYRYTAASPLEKYSNRGGIDIPRIQNSNTSIPGIYRIEIYEHDELYTAVEIEVLHGESEGSRSGNIAFCDVVS